MATTLSNLDLADGSVQVECETNEWGELDFNVFIFSDERKYHFVGCNAEQKVYVTILNADNSPAMLNKALYKTTADGDYEFVLLPKGYGEKEIVSACTEFVDTMN